MLSCKSIKEIIATFEEMLHPKRSGPETFALETLIEESIRDIENAFSVDVSSIATQFSSAQTFIRGEPHQLRRALGELIYHALKTIPARGSLRLILSKHAHEITLDINEEGSALGQPPKPGSGCTPSSLASAYEIIEWHGGRLNCQLPRVIITLPYMWSSYIPWKPASPPPASGGDAQPVVRRTPKILP